MLFSIAGHRKRKARPGILGRFGLGIEPNHTTSVLVDSLVEMRRKSRFRNKAIEELLQDILGISLDTGRGTLEEILNDTSVATMTTGVESGIQHQHLESIDARVLPGGTKATIRVHDQKGNHRILTFRGSVTDYLVDWVVDASLVYSDLPRFNCRFKAHIPGLSNLASQALVLSKAVVLCVKEIDKRNALVYRSK